MLARAGAAAMQSARRAPAPGPWDPSQIGSGASTWLRGAGITQALGAVASWDSEGSDGARYSSPAAANRPLAVQQGGRLIGRFDGVSTGPDHIVSENTLTLLRPYTIGIVCAVRSWPAVRNVVADFHATQGIAQLAAYGGSPNFFRWFDSNTQIATTTPVGEGEFVSLILRSDTSPTVPGTSRLLMNGVLEATESVGQRASAAATWTIGANVAVTSRSALDLADIAVWSGEYLDHDDIARLNAWHEHIKGAL